MSKEAVPERELKLANASDDGLTAIWVGVNAEGWVFFGQFDERVGHLFLVGFGLWLHRFFQDWFWEGEGFKDDWLVFIGEGVAGGRGLKTDNRADFTSFEHLDFLTVVGVHQDQAGDTFLITFSGVENVGTGFEHALVDTDVSKTSNEWVGRDLEGKADERLLVIGFADIRLAAERTFFTWDIQWGWEVIVDGIKEWLDAFVLIGGSAENWEEGAGKNGFADGGLDHFDRRFFTFEDHHHEIIVEGRELLEEDHAKLFAFILEISWDFADGR